MSVYPNPASDVIRVSAESLLPGNYRLQLFNQSGKLVSETSVFAAGARLEKNWSLPDVASGLYVVALVGEHDMVRQQLSIIR